MKAVQVSKYGDSSVLEVKVDVPKPSPQKDQILVEVHGVSLNPFDWKLRSGMLAQMIPLKFPVTWGGDFSGVVMEIGEGISEYKAGNEVFGSAIVLNGGSGSFAQFLVANTANVARKPKTVDYLQAASLPLVGSSAIQALEDHIKLQSGQKILIQGGVGGIGSIAIQVAKAMGAYVATTVSSDDREYVKSLGADEVIDYQNQHFEEILKDFDAVFDTVGGETTDKSFQVLKKGLPAGRQGGVLVSMLGQPNEELAQKYGVTAIGQNTQTNTRHLKRLAHLVDSGKIKPQIDRVFSLEQVKEAFDHLEKGHPRGKVVLKWY